MLKIKCNVALDMISMYLSQDIQGTNKIYFAAEGAGTRIELLKQLPKYFRT